MEEALLDWLNTFETCASSPCTALAQLRNGRILAGILQEIDSSFFQDFSTGLSNELIEIVTRIGNFFKVRTTMERNSAVERCRAQ
jgi:hypothetical protein